MLWKLRFMLVLTMACVVAVRAVCADRHWSRDRDDQIRVASLPVDRQLQNAPWPKDWEESFWRRANHVIRNTARTGGYGNTFFENEKRAYGWAMLSILAGHEQEGLKFLQEEDNLAERWNRHTLGIDYYPCFTLKHQMRKYFFFGDLLDAAYHKRMKDAARIFTERDPLRRPHYAYTGKGVWGPDGKNSWVDVRSTDNLKLMRDTSVYLLAEEAGNEETRRLYKEHLKTFVVSMYYMGMGEWDSENYLGHSIAPVLNLYDFSKDPEVRSLAKAALDWMAAAAAVKYWRGAYNGPSRRDYNHPYPFGGSAAALTWLWFGDSPIQPTEFESDEIHVITSAYRPPAAVVHLARKNFDKPAEIIAGKPEWSAWQDPDADRPTYRETHYFGRDYQFGTLARGSQEPDINGFKILTYSSQLGADTVTAAPISDPLKLGSVQYQEGILAPHSVVGQNGNMAIYLTQESDHPYLWLVPASAEIQERNGVVFICGERTTIALWPMNISTPRSDEGMTKTVQFREKKEKNQDAQLEPRWPNSQVLRATRQSKGIYGFAIEIDDGDRANFLRRASEIRPESEDTPSSGVASLAAVSGRRMRLQWGKSLETVQIWRDDDLRDWGSEAENVSWRTLDGDLIDQAWQGDGTLRVSAGGRSFSCFVSRDGKVTFAE